MARTAAALVIGNEILSGKVQEANVVPLANVLRSLGIELRRVVVIPDEVPLIAAEVNALRATHDLLFTSGGVGPTHDDVTVEGVARALGRQVVRQPELERLLRRYYGDRCTPDHLRMADVVEGSQMVGAAPGRWPTMALGNVYVLPGVPQIFREKLDGLRDLLRGDEVPYVLRSVYASADEGTIRPFIDAVVAAFPDLAVGSYPRLGDPEVSVRVTFDGRDPQRVSDAASQLAALLPPGSLVRVE